ncbi:MAG: glycosyltransferase family 39 protein [Rhodospirillales bacterium]|nr:glycosyltransferase family 39 protein [Rhodospirillales bacterium]MDH3969849.1 glycosyltransferase family 39 protein [Rhodospirillales bacterium]
MPFRTALATAIDGIAERNGGWLLTGRHFFVALALYVLVLFLIKGVLYSGGIGHDVDQLVKSQSFELGYDTRNPPLYTWLVIAAQVAFGVGLPAVLAVKSLMILSLYGFLYLSARRVLRDEALAVVTAMAPFAMYEIGLWLAIKYSHTAALAAACMVTLYALLRLEESGKTLWYAVLGCVIGLGLLAKYNYAIFLVSLLGAGLFDAGLRGRLGDLRMLGTAAIALLIALPHASWMVAQAAGFEDSATARFAMGTDHSWLAGLALGWASALKATLNMLVPLALAVPLLYWRASRTGVSGDWPARRTFRVLGILLGLSVAAVFVLVAVSGSTRVRGQYLFILVPFPLWLAAWAQGLGLSRRAVNRIALAFTALALLTPVLMLGKYLSEPLTRDYPRYNLSYAGLARQLGDAGFREGTIYAFDYPYSLSGNLRPYFPAARILGSGVPHTRPPAREVRGQCALIWAVDRKSVADRAMLESAQALLGFEGAAGSRLFEIEVAVENGRNRTVRFRIRLFPDGPGDCR